MNARKLLDLTRGAHALQEALAGKLDIALLERREAQDAAQHAERCLRAIEKDVLAMAGEPPSQVNGALWPSHLADRVTQHVSGLHLRIRALEADLASACAKVNQ